MRQLICHICTKNRETVQNRFCQQCDKKNVLDNFWTQVRNKNSALTGYYFAEVSKFISMVTIADGLMNPPKGVDKIWLSEQISEIMLSQDKYVDNLNAMCVMNDDDAEEN